MILTTPKIKKLKKMRSENLKLLGAIRINSTPFFIFQNRLKKIILKSAEEENAQKHAVKNMIELNPNVKKLLNKHNIKPNIDTKTFKDLANGHMNDTCKVAIGIYSLLSNEMKSKIKEDTIKEAAMLHDLGKVLIPSKILNKPARLNCKEREIMNIHSELGYELLKTQNIKEETLDLVKYHHQNLKRSGYPAITNEHTPSDIGVQIISTADKYSALREARVYRRKLSRIESMLIIYKEVLEGKIHKEIYKALIEYARIYDVN